MQVPTQWHVGCVKCGAGGAGRQSDGSRNMGSRDVGTEHLAAARGLRAAELNTGGQVAAHNVSRQREKKVRCPESRTRMRGARDGA